MSAGDQLRMAETLRVEADYKESIARMLLNGSMSRTLGTIMRSEGRAVTIDDIEKAAVSALIQHGCAIGDGDALEHSLFRELVDNAVADGWEGRGV